ncbi:MAG: response regulator [Oxalicibacterium faecigallinarum]|uniref:response regulator n=1 Tax=Oxalicibacterium faecigallinarum TaxID=573741 RepID=UPI0028071D48|nr:response regulator [Oxalicibacterium faecigallinarum]MDQ7968448.1 response regulator [Oxalicibacterium faecigallinarum]
MRKPVSPIRRNKSPTVGLLNFNQNEIVSGRTILIVDDEQDLREVISTLLEAAGYVTVCASSVSTAFAALHEYTIDLVLTDVLMPDAFGTLLQQWMLDDPSFKDIPLIFMSGYVPATESLNRPVLKKPFGLTELLAFIQKEFEKE